MRARNQFSFVPLTEAAAESLCVTKKQLEKLPQETCKHDRGAVRKTNSSFVIIVQNKLSTLGDHFDLTDPATAPTVLILVLVAPLTVRIM